ncbi:ABC transporter permease [Luteipulveratus mongoliensis]|uniref:ABC transporter permease n=1 Tax=Luteipulveratus mongoliensis TaxID=571913 RepID=A0A0K1JJ17_9MICO|nr:ABC transporter permease [Luteipulveratus mongoliensis]AKU16704.1 ABC transporter permease [Luteipulveratus mongoliensis]
MLVYILRRLILGISVIAAAITTTFILFFLGPNDPAGAMCGDKCTPERLELITQSLGLDKPVSEQFTQYASGLVVGTHTSVRTCDAPCFGWSYFQNRPVRDIVFEALPVTVSLVVGGAIAYTTVALIFGVLAARQRATWVDRVIVGGSQLLGSIPYFVIALLFFLYLMVFWEVIPRANWVPLTDNPWKWFTGLIGVWIFFGIVQSTGYIRYVRASMIDTQNQDYVRTARSKGLSEGTIAVKHSLRAAIAPVVTLVGLNIAGELSGTVITESIFGLPGMGRTAILAFNTGDLPIISGVVLMGCFFVVIINLVVDLLYGVVDPRVKLT